MSPASHEAEQVTSLPISEAQLRANRENAQHSTGPKQYADLLRCLHTETARYSFPSPAEGREFDISEDGYENGFEFSTGEITRAVRREMRLEKAGRLVQYAHAA